MRDGMLESSDKATAGHGGASTSADARRKQAGSSALITVLLVIFAASAALWYATVRHGGEQPAMDPNVAAQATPAARARKIDPVAAARFARPAAASCDGRMRCSQMNSCAEAKYFLANCPAAAAEMDSNLNGIPCDTQWCTASALQMSAR